MRPGEIREDAAARVRRQAGLRLLLKVAAALAVVWLLGRLLDVVRPPSLSSAGGRTSYSYRADGYRGSLELLRALGHRAEPKRTSYGQLPAEQSGVLVRIDPLPAGELEEWHGQSVDRGQVETLERWLAAGGRLLATAPARRVQRVAFLGAEFELEPEGTVESTVDAVLEDAPPAVWGKAQGELAWEPARGGGRERWSFPRGRAARLAAPFLSSSPQRFRIGGGVEPDPELQAFAEPVPESWTVEARLDGRPFVLSRREGEGETWLVASAWPFSNLALARHGTAAFVARLTAEVAGTERVLHFDEYAHGLWERGGWLFWMRQDVLLYPALGFGLVAALLLWRGARRLGPPADEPEPPRRAKEEFVVGIADVAQRAGRHRAAARSLLAVYRARLAEQGLAGASDPGWEHLAARTAGRCDLAALREVAREADRLYRHELEQAGLAARAPRQPVLSPS